jgi:hypothetical protein
MPISHTKKIIFIHIPKNAGTSISALKELNFGNVEHKSFRQYRRLHPIEWEEYTKISIVRNPWDRFVSCYEYARMLNSYWHSNDGQKSIFGPHPDHKTVKNICFEEFTRKFFTGELRVNHQCWVPQSSWICNKNNETMVDKLFRLENLNNNEEFKNIFGEIEKINQSKRLEYKEYYTSQQSIEIVGEAYKEDVKNFNYSF